MCAKDLIFKTVNFFFEKLNSTLLVFGRHLKKERWEGRKLTISF
jgi:hypothetical protein